MLTELRRGVLFTIVTMVLFGGVYHLLIWSIGRIFPRQAEGSLVRRADGTVIGSSLIAQKFTRPQYFHPRPSAVDYNAASAGGSNYGPSNPEYPKLVHEMATASGSGLDPHIPPAAAELQIARVARARNVNPATVRELVREHTEAPLFGVFGRARVNVLELNLALDQELPSSAPSPRSGAPSPRKRGEGLSRGTFSECPSPREAGRGWPKAG